MALEMVHPDSGIPIDEVVHKTFIIIHTIIRYEIMVDGLTEWNKLSSRRQKLLLIIKNEYTPDDTFRRTDVDDLLEDGDNTTTEILNNIANEDNYLTRISVGKGPLLIVNKTHGEDETAASPPQQERLARKAVNEESLELTPENYQWANTGSRKSFTSKFNSKSNNIYECYLDE